MEEEVARARTGFRTHIEVVIDAADSHIKLMVEKNVMIMQRS